MMTRSSDILIVGAGVIGLATAWELSRLGVRVTVIDRRRAGEGASQASAGMLAPHIEAHDEPQLWRLGVRSLDMYDSFIARLQNDSGRAIDYRRSGSLHLALHDWQMDSLHNVAGRLAAAGVRADLLDRALVRELEPQVDEQVAGGVFIASHGYVKVPDLIAALVAAATRHEVNIETHVVRRVSRSSSGVVVETEDGSREAAAVIIAAGCWSGQVAVAGDEPVPVRPVRGQLIHLGSRKPLLAQILWGSDCYLVPWADGTLLVGATVEDAGFDERATAAGVRDLLDAACDMLPGAWQASVAGIRVGLRPGTPDCLPVVGPSPNTEGVYYATGHYRNGVLLTPVTAMLLTDLIAGGKRDEALDTLKPDRFNHVRRM